MSFDCYCAYLLKLIVKITHLQHCTVSGLIIEFVMFSVWIECFKHIIAVQQQNEVFSITVVLVWLVLRFQVFLHHFAKQSLSCASESFWSRLLSFYD